MPTPFKQRRCIWCRGPQHTRTGLRGAGQCDPETVQRVAKLTVDTWEKNGRNGRKTARELGVPELAISHRLRYAGLTEKRFYRKAAPGVEKPERIKKEVESAKVGIHNLSLSDRKELADSVHAQLRVVAFEIKELDEQRDRALDAVRSLTVAIEERRTVERRLDGLYSRLIDITPARPASPS